MSLSHLSSVLSSVTSDRDIDPMAEFVVNKSCKGACSIDSIPDRNAGLRYDKRCCGHGNTGNCLTALHTDEANRVSLVVRREPNTCRFKVSKANAISLQAISDGTCEATSKIYVKSYYRQPFHLG